MTTTPGFNEITIAASEAMRHFRDAATSLADNYSGGTVPLLGVVRRFDDVQAELDTARLSVVAELRALDYSWQEIGDALGVSRQAAQQRYGATSAILRP